MKWTNRAVFALGACAGAGLMLGGAAIVPHVWAQEKPAFAPLKTVDPLSPERQAVLMEQLGAAEIPMVNVEMQMSNDYVAVRRGLKVYLYKIDKRRGSQTFTAAEALAR